MVQIVQGKKKESFGNQIMQGFANIGNEKNRLYEQDKQKENMNKLGLQYGIEGLGNYDEKTRQELIGSALQGKRQEEKYGFEEKLLNSKNEQEQNKLLSKNKENSAPLEAGLKTIGRMRDIRKKGNIGFSSGVRGIYHKRTRKERAEYETLGNSLIGLASTIPIRNKQEFETLTGKLNDPSLTLAEIDGVLEGIERIITQNMSQYQTGTVNEKKPPLSSFRTK